MQAAQIDRYAKDADIVVREVPMPELSEGDVLVRVAFAAVNPVDQLIREGSVRLIQDYAMPVALGNEFSGVVEETGSGVSGFREGDRVCARLPKERIGAFSEYVAVDQSLLVKIPDGMGFEEAAAIPLAGLAAYQAIVEELEAKSGDTVLILGASGGFGQVAVPVAKALGLNVVVTGNARSKERFLDMGVERYIDYREENYWETISSVDHVIDALGDAERALSVLKEGGTVVSLKAGPNKAFAERNGIGGLKKAIFSVAGKKLDKAAKKQGKKYRFLFVRADGGQLREVMRIAEESGFMPAVNSHEFVLSQVEDALRLANEGPSNGKVLIRMKEETQ